MPAFASPARHPDAAAGRPARRTAPSLALAASLALASASTPAQAPPEAAPADDGEQALAQCLQAATRELPAPARLALERIDGLPRQLLAARSYLRSDSLEARWSWNDQQVLAYEQSPERQRAMLEIERVQRRFAELNPGYRLLVNVQVRSLDLQLQRWNENASVRAASLRLLGDAGPACQRVDPRDFAGWLRQWTPSPPPNLAAPGLSPHGQGRAYDFQIFDANGLVAGTDASRIRADWVQPGWTAKLATAVADASPMFIGPLLSPNEPWHYAYVPMPAAGMDAAR